jgi:LuxR family maltose regulon positive regulatory protein
VTIPLLSTKLYIPPPQPNLVARPHLVERLTAGLNRKLTLISAPAGFGKTTLLSEWVAGRRRSVAWLSLDQGDNDPVRFMAYVVAALQTVEGHIGQGVASMLQLPQLPPAESILTVLINEVALAPKDSILILDDYHAIEAQPIHEALAFLLDHLPPQMHLILSSRADPPWPLARLRARREMSELRANDLRFTLQEAAVFLNEAMTLDLSAKDVATLEARTEGWIVGLQMAALSMRGRRDVSGFIKAFTGSHRFILDYLVEEVLDQQPPGIQDFLLRTSVLDRMTAALCDSVTDGRDSQTILTDLERANLFLVPLDDERRWYRYHHLFADLLRSRLELIQLDQVPALHRRASVWYERNSLPAKAVSHALKARDMKRVAHLVAQNALILIYHGQLLSLARSLSTLPKETPWAYPWLRVAYAWAMAYAGQLDDVEPALQEAEEALISIQNADEVRHVMGHIAAIRAYTADLKGELSGSVAFARQALDRLPEEELTVRGFTLSLLGTALRDSGDLVAAARTTAEAIAIGRAAGDSRVVVTALCELAVLQLWQGYYHRAVDTCQEGMELADEFAARVGQPLPVTALIYARLSNVLQEWNDLEKALYYAREAVRLSELWGQADISIIAFSRLSSVLEARGDLDGALEALAKARQVASDVSPWYGALMDGWEAALRLTHGDLEAAARWAKESSLSADDEFTHDGEGQYRILARVLIAQGKLGRAMSLLARLRETTEAAGATPQLVSVLTLQALGLRAQGKLDEAVAVLGRALTLAEPEGYVRTFVGGGAPMGELLTKVAVKGIEVGYTGRLLAALGGETIGGPRAAELIEPLSRRELEVLRLLTTSLTTTEIAHELFIAASTVRSHVKSIYGKLGVHSRMEAVIRAQDLELL